MAGDQDLKRRSTASTDGRDLAELPDPSIDPVRVGVVLVHGIGSQKPGQTLRDVADRLIAFWTERQPDLKPTLSGTAIRDDHPSTTLTLSPPAGTAVAVRLYEAHWADSFYPPPAARVLAWIAFVAPLTLATRGVELIQASFDRWHRSPVQWWRIVAAAAVTAIGFPVLMAALLLVGVSALLRPLIPFAAVKQALGSFEAAISQVLGDSYLYLMSPSDADAIASVVRETLSRADDNNEAVIVVAHSQGAQVAVDVLKSRTVAVAHLLTLGSGVGQLEWLRHTLKDGSGPFVFGAAAWAWALAAPAAVAAGAWHLQEGGSDGFAFLFGAAGLVYWFPYSLVFVVQWVRTKRRAAVLPQTVLESVRRWTDLNATADPVSGVALLRKAYPQVQERAVVNRNSVLSDHTSYFSNGPEVLAVLADAIVDAARESKRNARATSGSDVDRRGFGFTTLTPADSTVEEGHRAGRWRVGNRWVALLAAALVLSAVLSRLPQLSEQLWALVMDVGLAVGLDAPQKPPTVAGAALSTIGVLVVTTVAVAALTAPAVLLVRWWIRSVYRAEPGKHHDARPGPANGEQKASGGSGPAGAAAVDAAGGPATYMSALVLGAQVFCLAGAAFAASRVEQWGTVDVWPWVVAAAAAPAIGLILAALLLKRVTIPDWAYAVPVPWAASAALLIGAASTYADGLREWTGLLLAAAFPVLVYAAARLVPVAAARRLRSTRSRTAPQYGISELMGALALLAAAAAVAFALPHLSLNLRLAVLLPAVIAAGLSTVFAFEVKDHYPRTYRVVWPVAAVVTILAFARSCQNL